MMKVKPRKYVQNNNGAAFYVSHNLKIKGNKKEPQKLVGCWIFLKDDAWLVLD